MIYIFRYATFQMCQRRHYACAAGIKNGLIPYSVQIYNIIRYPPN